MPLLSLGGGAPVRPPSKYAPGLFMIGLTMGEMKWTDAW